MIQNDAEEKHRTWTLLEKTDERITLMFIHVSPIMLDKLKGQHVYLKGYVVWKHSVYANS